MISFKSGSPSAFGELKELLSLLSHPDKAKSALKELDERLEEAYALEKKLSEKSSQLSQLEEKVSEREKFVALKEKQLIDTEAALALKVSSFNKRESEFESKKKSFDEANTEFLVFKSESLLKLSEMEKDIEAKMAEAKILQSQAEAMKKEFDDKLQKIKALQ